ncbi:DUF7210 family protein [Neptuniibacter sp.]|uniref:DUF7210 family protein n=1 Tax=Neptuniibacter sp. TaxID=1962643 RepID=UPI003B5921BB
MSGKAQEQKEKLIEVTLAKPHTHKGEPKKPGEKIKVNARRKQRLEEREIIEKATTN